MSLPFKERVLGRIDWADGSVSWTCYELFSSERWPHVRLPWIPDRLIQGIDWCALPALDDPRWRAGEPSGGKEGELILIHYGTPSLVHHESYSSNRSIPFPGFMNGPMYRYQGVKGWMPIAELASTLQAVPEPVLRAELPYMVDARAREEELGEAGFQLCLAVVNDGPTYQRHLAAFANGDEVRYRNWRLNISHYNDSRRAPALLAWAREIVGRYWVQYPEAIDWPRYQRDKLVAVAAHGLLAYYVREHQIRNPQPA